MKSNYILIAAILALRIADFSVSAQESKTITVKAGTRVIDYFPFNERYRYPEFNSGKVTFKNGTFTAARLNYNILLGEFQFIQNKDTLAIANVKEINKIEVKQDTFVYENGILEIVAGHDPARMAVRQYVKILDTKKNSAYGTQSSTSAIDTYSSVSMQQGSRYYKLTVNEDVVLSVNTDYYLGNQKSGFLPYRKKNILKLLPQHESDIDTYLKGNPVDFKNKEDLIRLTLFLQDILKI